MDRRRDDEAAAAERARVAAEERLRRLETESKRRTEVDQFRAATRQVVSGSDRAGQADPPNPRHLMAGAAGKGAERLGARMSTARKDRKIF